MARLDPMNPKGDVALVTSLKIRAKGKGGQMHEIGSAVQINPSESRNVQYNFVIGNEQPDEARDLVPGTINRSTLTVNYVALYKENVIEAFGKADGDTFLNSLRQQNRPFQVVEEITDVSESKTRTITYDGCYISDYTARRDISSGADIRILEDCTIHYRTIQQTYE
jgi:hypothetical protein